MLLAVSEEFVDKGKEILKNSGLNFIVAQTMKDAAEKVVAAADGSRAS